MKVRIAFVTDVNGDIDVDRVGTIEDHPDEDARRLIKEGIAAEPTADELADWDALVERKLAAEEGDLSTLTVRELRDKYPAAAALPTGTKKDDIVAAVEEARRAELAGPAAEAETAPGGDTDEVDSDSPDGTDVDEQ